MDLLQELERARGRVAELEARLAEPGILADPKKLRVVNADYLDAKELVEIGQRYADARGALESAKATLSESTEADMRALAQDEIDELTAKLPRLEEAFTLALLPPDPLDKKDIIMEIRAGTGGDEA